MNKKQLKKLAELVREVVKREVPKAVQKSVKGEVRKQLNEYFNKNGQSGQNRQRQQENVEGFSEEQQLFKPSKDDDKAKSTIFQKLNETAAGNQGGYNPARAQQQMDPSKIGYGNMQDMVAGKGNFDNPNYGHQGVSPQQAGQQQMMQQQPMQQPMQHQATVQDNEVIEEGVLPDESEFSAGGQGQTINLSDTQKQQMLGGNPQQPQTAQQVQRQPAQTQQQVQQSQGNQQNVDTSHIVQNMAGKGKEIVEKSKKANATNNFLPENK